MRILTLLAVAFVGALNLVAVPAQADCGARVQSGTGTSGLVVAQRCGQTLQRLKSANPNVDFDRALKGELLKVPPVITAPVVPSANDRGASPGRSYGRTPAVREPGRSLLYQRN